MNTQYINLDISKAFAPNRSITIGQGDLGGTTIVATIYDNGSLLSLSGLSAHFFIRLPNSVGYVEDENCTVSGNTITYVVDEEHCAYMAGVTQDAYFALYSGTTRIYSTARFTVKILQSAADGVDLAGSWNNDIQQAVADMNAATEEARQAVSDISEALSTAEAAAESAAQASTNAEAATEEARQAVSDISEALSTAEAAAESAAQASTRANTAADNANYVASETEDRIEAAIATVTDLSQLLVPLMSEDTQGGAKLGDGLAVDDGTLHLGQLTKASTGEVYGPLASVTAKGHAEQFSTTGKNLLAPYTISNSNVRRNADGSVTIVSLPNSGQSFTVGSITLVGGQSYVMSGAISSASYMYVPVDGANKSDTGNSVVITPSADQTVYVSCVITSNSVVGTTFYPQLELGSTATPYEPYTGGEASPSPDYPQEIKVARGRNLLPNSEHIDFTQSPFSQSTSTDSTSDVYDGEKIISTNATTKQIRIDCDGLIAGETYTLSFDVSRGTYSAYGVYFAYGTDAISSIGLAPNNRWNRVSVTFVARSEQYLYITTNSAAGAYYRKFQLTLGSIATPYVPYGYVGLEVRHANILDLNTIFASTGHYSVNPFGYVTVNSLDNDRPWPNLPTQMLAAGTYTITNDGSGFLEYRIGSSTTNVRLNEYESKTFTLENSSEIRVKCGLQANYPTDVYVRLISGHVIGERNKVIPIPLPQRGWVGGLSDGNADELRIDSAGHVEWLQRVVSYTVTGEENYSSADLGTYIRLVVTLTTSTTSFDTSLYGADVTDQLCTHAPCTAGYSTDSLKANVSRSDNVSYGNTTLVMFGAADTAANALSAYVGAIILYASQNPVTEDCGYVDLPDIPSDATVSIPELENLGVKWWVDSGSVVDYHKDLQERLEATNLAEIEDAISDLASITANLIAHDQFYFGYDEVNGKKMISIFKRGDD